MISIFNELSTIAVLCQIKIRLVNIYMARKLISQTIAWKYPKKFDVILIQKVKTNYNPPPKKNPKQIAQMQNF